MLPVANSLENGVLTVPDSTDSSVTHSPKYRYIKTPSHHLTNQIKVTMKLFASLLTTTLLSQSLAFVLRSALTCKSLSNDHSLHSTVAPVTEDSKIQWDLFVKHHAKGAWKGVWTTYDYIGDVLDETVAAVVLELDESNNRIQHTHKIAVGATKSECAKCFDSEDIKSFPVATYTPDQMHKARLGSVGLINGPTLLRSGAMATELVLSYGDGRVRVVFQHAPVWKAGVDPGSGPPAGLKIYRTMLSREALRDDSPTVESEAVYPPTAGNPVFFRGVPPFYWHKVWGGTSWTWGPQSGNKGWAITEMEESDAWHGRPTGDNENCWNLRLPGGILLQGPRVIQGGEAGIFRLAWLPNDETLLRIEGSVIALEPMSMDDQTLAGFYPPSLGSLRCDVLTKLREPENTSMLFKQGEQEGLRPKSEEEIAIDRAARSQLSQTSRRDDENNGGSGLDAVRAALSSL